MFTSRNSFSNAFIWSSHDTDCEFNCCVDFIKMIKDVTYLKCDLMLSPSPSPSSLSSSFGSVAQRMCRRKRRHITTYYIYCSHRVFCVLLLLIYSYILIQSPATVLAETAMSQIKTSGNDEFTKTSNEMDRVVKAVRLDEHEDEYFDDDQDDTEYKELLSNKSGKCNNHDTSIFPLIPIASIVFIVCNQRGDVSSHVSRFFFLCFSLYPVCFQQEACMWALCARDGAT